MNLSQGINVVLLSLRLIIGILLFPNGLKLVSNYRSSLDWLTGHEFSYPIVAAYLIIVIQFYSCFFLTLGIASRYLAVFVIVSALITIPYHFGGNMSEDWLGQPIGQGIVFHLILLFSSMVLVKMGSGRFSVDYMISRILS